MSDAKEMDTVVEHFTRLTDTVQRGLPKYPNSLDGLLQYIENYIKKDPTNRRWCIDVSDFDDSIVDLYMTTVINYHSKWWDVISKTIGIDINECGAGGPIVDDHRHLTFTLDRSHI